ncbi:MAG: beta-lactamase family protein [Ruminococcaceae bacterium]|nr:beta-lactamase family protein [Oscillospiraceae bacterium]
MELFPYASPSEVGLSDRLTAGIDKMAEDDIAAGEIVCAAIQVICKDKTVYKKCHGYADLENKIPLEENHIFRMASMTKPITAVCVLREMEEGRLNLDDPAGKYVPELMDMEVAEFDGENKRTGTHPAPRPITIRDLLSHSSGIGSSEGDDNCNGGVPNGYVLGDKMKDWGASYLGFDPGTQAYYSWLVGFDVLAHIVEVTSGMTYAEYAQKYIFDPLDMKDTGFAPTEEQWERAVNMYMITAEKKSELLAQYKRMICTGPASYHSGAANVVSTLPDYSRFAHMLCNDGISCGVRILKAETVQEMRKPQLPLNLPGTDESHSWGLGVQVVMQDKGHLKYRLAGTFGWSGAFGTHFWCDPARQLSVVYCTNMLGGPDSDEVTRRHIEKAVLENM